METRIAVIGILVEQPDMIAELNTIMHDFSRYIIGRMGIPYQNRGVNIISIAVDAPQDTISALSGKIGRLKGITAKTAYSSLTFTDDER